MCVCVKESLDCVSQMGKTQLKYGWHNSMDWGPRLNKMEKASQAHAFIVLWFPTVGKLDHHCLVNSLYPQPVGQKKPSLQTTYVMCVDPATQKKKKLIQSGAGCSHQPQPTFSTIQSLRLKPSCSYSFHSSQSICSA